MNEIDILKEIETSSFEPFYENEEDRITYIYETIVNQPKKVNRLLSTGIFAFKYIATSSLIFAVLLVSTNYNAYINIAKSYLMPEQAEEVKNSILNSVEAAKISDTSKQKDEELNIVNEEKVEEQLSINKYKKELDSSAISLNIDITTLENRIIIPKMGKNIPLIDIKNRSISGQSELNDIFMEELENGVIRYPWSAKPGENGLSFIFGHSSNFPWLKWNYNSVFATIDRVMIWDEVIVYYNQKKYTFKIVERAIIKPGDVGILKRNNKKSEIAIMTCRPVWTTLNRFVIVGELVG